MIDSGVAIEFLKWVKRHYAEPTAKESCDMAIEALENNDKLAEDLQNCLEMYKKKKAEVEALKNPWIPCEERVPEPYEDVIVCSDIGNIEIAHGDYMDYLDGGWDWLISGWKFGEVIAWMPLPKPYEGRTE